MQFFVLWAEVKIHLLYVNTESMTYDLIYFATIEQENSEITK